MSYLSLKKILVKLRQSSLDIEEEKDVTTIEVLLDTIQTKLKKILGSEMELYTQISDVMGSELEVAKTELSKSEMTRLLIVYDYQRQFSKLPTLELIAKYKKQKPSRDDIANEGRILYRLERKEMIDVNRNVDQSDHFMLSEQGKNYLSTFILGTNFIVEIYQSSRNKKIKEFLLKYLETRNT